MGKRCKELCVFKCVVFNLSTGGNGVMIQTDLYFTKTCNLVTMQWCTFGGQTSAEQISTTAQNQQVPCEFRPTCDQIFLIAGTDVAIAEGKVMKLRITADGDITFILSLDGTETPVFPVFDGSSATWIVAACC